MISLSELPAVTEGWSRFLRGESIMQKPDDED